MHARRPLLALALSLLAGCSDRQRSNPLDPNNPATQGAPIGFSAKASDHSVALDWVSIPRGEIIGFQLFRRVTGETTFTAISAVLPTAAASYSDVGLLNGIDHEYRLYYVFTDGLHGKPASDVATPGAARPWVTDFSSRSVLRLTPDARRVGLTDFGGYQSPGNIDVDPAREHVWICDTFAGRLFRLKPSINEHVTINTVNEPVDVAVDPGTGDVWVCDQGQGAVLRFGEDGNVSPLLRIGDLLTPLAVAVDPNDGSIWVCERDGSMVRHFDTNGVPLSGTPLGNPSRVAVDSLTRSAWVTSFTQGRVVRYDAGGTARDTVGGFSGPIGIAVDSRLGIVWVADAAANRVVALDRLGDQLFALGGLSQAREIGLDRATGQVWVTLPGAGAVALITPAGQVVRRVIGLSQPYDVAVGRVFP
jgi:DNA-binding beta-propeller fold protein YncE